MTDEKQGKGNVEKAETVFVELFGSKQSTAIQPYQTHKIYRRIFTPLIVLWCMIFQRLNFDHTCDAVISKLRSGDFDQIEKDDSHQVRLSERIVSVSSSGYCQARQRIPLVVFKKALRQTFQYIQTDPIKDFEWLGQNVFLLDGSTVKTRPYPDLVKEYGQHKTGKELRYWVVMRITCLFCLQTGLLAEVQEGPLSTSEVALAAECLPSLSPNDILVADRGFGIFRMLQEVSYYHGRALFRLSRTRAGKVFKEYLRSNQDNHTQLYPGYDINVVWTPSPQDTLNPNMPATPIAGRLIYVRLENPGFRPQDLYLFTTLLDREVYTRTRLVKLYGLRWHVELDLRFVKQTLDLDTFECKSVDIFRKELLAGMIGYNLIRLFMVQAAKQSNCSVLTLSFTMCLRRVATFLFHGEKKGTVKKLLSDLALCTLPERPKPRSEPRWVRPRDKSYPEFWEPRPLARARAFKKQAAANVC